MLFGTWVWMYSTSAPDIVWQHLTFPYERRPLYYSVKLESNKPDRSQSQDLRNFEKLHHLRRLHNLTAYAMDRETMCILDEQKVWWQGGWNAAHSIEYGLVEVSCSGLFENETVIMINVIVAPPRITSGSMHLPNSFCNITKHPSVFLSYCQWISTTLRLLLISWAGTMLASLITTIPASEIIFLAVIWHLIV